MLADLLKDRRPIVYAVVLLAVLFAAMAVYSHTAYTENPVLSMRSVLPILYGQPGFVGPFNLGGIRINVVNNGSSTEPVSFYIVSRSPNGEKYILSTQMNVSIGPQMLQAHSSQNYTLPYRLPLVNNSTKIYVFAFSPDYISSKEYQIDLVH